MAHSHVKSKLSNKVHDNVQLANSSCFKHLFIEVEQFYHLSGGGVAVIRSPHDPEVPSSNPGKINTSDFSIRDPLSRPSCDWYRIYLAMWWNSLVGRAADLMFSHIFRIVWMCKHMSVLNE